ncbi:pyroglutamyl-peptidase 1-like protein isoform X3 [Ictalurus furcatus]|uniref:pyroglutamyl-peptidase 1-like protein isoform X3 n=1 Tax=Ictalurus furcatus TaxID=66913 RepID=UPI0023501CA6|nr:pyroglutamyl-peptidase 1-like protein isoform X3 [Ictalurus furcatus]
MAQSETKDASPPGCFGKYTAILSLLHEVTTVLAASQNLAPICECVCAWCPVMDWRLIQGVFQLRSQLSWNRLWICCYPDKVAIHVGIASGTKSIILEQTGKNTGYKDRDVRGICPADNCCIQGGAEHLDSIIDMRSISKRLKELGLDVIYSRDAGRYLCDFLHYLSLHYGQRRAALIHVPACGSLASPGKLVPQLQTIIQVMLCQLDTQRI